MDRITAKKPGAKTSATTKVAKKTSVKVERKANEQGAAKAADGVSAARKLDEEIASLGDWRGELLAEIRALIHEVAPDVIEDWKWMGSPVWSHDGMFALANAHKDKVKVTFHHGAQLADLGKLFNAGLEGNKWRAIDFRQGDKINKTKFKALLREAIDYNARHAVPKSKGSRSSLCE